METIDSAGTSRSAREESEERRISDEERARRDAEKCFELKPQTVVVSWAQLAELKAKAVRK